MDSHTFRPALIQLDDRCLPSTVTPAQVYGSYNRVEYQTDAMKSVLDTLSQPITAQRLAFIQTRLPQVVTESQQDAAVLQAFIGDAKVQMAVNPASAAQLQPVVSAAEVAVVEALVNEAYARYISPGFGAQPPSPPPPPPPVDTPPDFGTVPTPAGITTTNPPGSTLPFSLSDPSWQNQPSGVRTWDTVAGTGAAARVGGQVSFNYTGYLLDGTVFDSSAKQGKPLTTTLDTAHLIQGFVNGLPGLQVGGTRRIQIPANQAYGSTGTTGVPPNSELVFEVTLVSAS